MTDNTSSLLQEGDKDEQIKALKEAYRLIKEENEKLIAANKEEKRDNLILKIIGVTISIALFVLGLIFHLTITHPPSK